MAHVVGLICEGQYLEGWISYSIQVSMLNPAGAFTFVRPFDNRAWVALRRDAKVTIVIDGTRVLTGIIDRRRKISKANAMEITGRSVYGRIVQESAPTISYEKIKMVEAVRRLCSPHISQVVTSGAADRNLRRGRGRKVPSGTEPLIVDLPVPKRGRVHPGTARGAIIRDLTSQAQCLVWESGDGQTVIVGKPNYRQAAQFLVCNAKTGSRNPSTCKDLELVEDNGDRYSLIVVAGAGSGDLANYGNNVTSRVGRARDNDDDDAVDGTGRDFLRPKRLLMPERDFSSVADARRDAEREKARRDFARESAIAPMKDHGQMIAGSTAPTIYAPNTIARVLDEDFDPPYDENYLIHTLTFDGSRGEQTTRLEMVPVGTEIIP